MSKIIFLSRLYHPHVGGIEQVVEKFSIKLTEEGHSVTVVTERYDKRLKKFDERDKVKIIRIDYPKIKYFGLVVIWCKLLKHVNEFIRADFVHAHGIFEWYYPMRLLFPFKPIYTTYYGWEGTSPIPKKNKIFRRISNYLSTETIADADFIHKHYEINTDYIRYPSVSMPKDKNFKKDEKFILYVGRLDRDTGLGVILSGLKEMRDYKIEFCGDGELRNECESLGKVYGFIDPRPYYKRAQYCVSAGHTSILEAMAYECLVVTTYNNKVKEDYLKMTPFSKWNIIVNKGEDVANKIIYYTKNRNKREKLIRNGAKWVKQQNFDLTYDFYKRIWKLK